MDFKDKADSLAQKMNQLTEKLTENLDGADELVIQGDDIIDLVEEKTQDIELYKDHIPVEQIINLNNMVKDFTYVRETLKENTDNARRVLNAITLDLLDSDDDKRAPLVLSFAELNKAVALNMKLYIQSYKEISSIILNIDKVKKTVDGPSTVNNTLNINTTENVSTADLIKQISAEKEE